MSRYMENLIFRVIDESEANSWNDAVLEWEIIDCEEDDELSLSCICGKENLRYLYIFVIGYIHVYSCHLFLISSASVRSIPFLPFIEPIFA